MAEGISLLVLRPDVQQGHPGLLHPQHPLGVEVPEISKLQQVLRRTLGVGAAVAEHHLPALAGDPGCHGGPPDAPDTLHKKRRPGEQGPRGPGGDEGFPLPGLQQLKPHCQGGVLLLLEREGRVVGHGDDLRRVADLHPLWQRLLPTLLQAAEDVLAAAHQQNVHAEVPVGLQRALHVAKRRVVAAHGVYDDPHCRISSFRAPMMARDRAESSAFLLRFPLTR